MTRLLVCLIAALTIACGGEKSPTSPTPVSTPTPAPTPAPVAATFSFSGTVSEASPTTGTRIPNAIVRILDGPYAGRTATADGAGAYQFSGLNAADFNTAATAAGYIDQGMGVQLSANRTINFNLRPIAQTVSQTLSGSISGGDPVCAGSSIGGKPCRRFAFNIYNGGAMTATLTWSNRDNDLDLELWRGTTQIAESTGVSAQEQVSSTVTAGNAYELRVVYYGGSTIQNFELRVTRPN